MRVRVYTAGDPDHDASARYRLSAPADVLREQGVDIEVGASVPGVVWKGTMMGDARVVGWDEPDCDVLVIQRPLGRDMADFAEVASKHVTVVVDMDDDFYTVSKDNAAWARIQPKYSPKRNTDHLRRAIAAAHMVTVSTPALAKRYGSRKSVVLPNYVSEQFLKIPLKGYDFDVCAGWTGTIASHPHDLESTKGGVARAVLESGADFSCVGDGAGVQEALGLSSLTKFAMTGWVPFTAYPDAMSSIDVGIVPLHSSAFNHGKSWLKGLEFAALGVPFVASNTQPYVELSKTYGLGFIARTPQEWYEHTLKLCSDEDYRLDTGEQGREVVRRHLLIEDNAERWIDAWCLARAQSSPALV